MKIVICSIEQEELGEYPRLSWDIAGLGKGEADVGSTELNFAIILSVKYPAVKETEMESTEIVWKKVVSKTKYSVF